MVRTRRYEVLIAAYSILTLLGCGDLKAEKDRIEQVTGAAIKKVTPVGGVIRINGETEPGVVMTLHSSDGSSAIPIATPFTEEDGKFEFTTYIKGDGLQAGDYKLTFEWLKVIKKGGIDFRGPDKLKGAYRNPAKSTFLLKIENGVPQKNLEFDLKTKG